MTKNLSAKRLKDKGGVALLLDALDDEYLGLQEDRLDEVAEEFATCRKAHGESMSRFIRRLEEARRELEDEDEEMFVSEKFFAWMLLRRAGLTVEEKSRVRSAIHCSEDPRDIAYALKRLFPRQKVGLQSVYARHGAVNQGNGYARQALLASFPEEEENDSEESQPSFDDPMTDDDEEDESAAPDDLIAAMQVVRAAERQGVDVYAAYRTAKSQQKKKSKSRGFFKRTFKHPQGQSPKDRQKELDQAKAASARRACGAAGHWKRGPVCPKYQEIMARTKVHAANVVQTPTD